MVKLCFLKVYPFTLTVSTHEKCTGNLTMQTLIILLLFAQVPYFFDYKTEFFLLQKQSQRSRSIL